MGHQVIVFRRSHTSSPPKLPYFGKTPVSVEANILGDKTQASQIPFPFLEVSSRYSKLSCR